MREADPAKTVDRFLGGLVTLVQPRKGHRAGLDAAVLQALVPADASGTAVDLGAGTGVVAFAIATRAPGLKVIAIERDPETLRFAQAGLALADNAGFAHRVRLVQADVTIRREERETLGLPDHSADWVLMNPPFDVPRTGRPSPDPARREAHIGDDETLPAWCRTAAGLLRPGGVLGLIHRSQALPAVLEALSGRFGDVRIRPVHPRDGAPANRILVRATRDSRAAAQILPGLVLHEEDGGWTARAEAILRGRGDLAG